MIDRQAKRRMGNLWALGVAWLAVFFVVLWLSWSRLTESTRFFGIADSREIVINSENPVEIEQIHVVEGERVVPGQLLVELKNPELAMRISEIVYQLERLDAQQEVDKAALQAKIIALTAEKKSKTEETHHRVHELENLYRINTVLATGLKSIPQENNRVIGDNPLVLQIERLKNELASTVHLLDLQIEMQQQALDNADKPISIVRDQLNAELAMLKREHSKLTICSSLSGVIGSVNARPGEKVAPFQAIATLHTRTPAIVKGFIREHDYSRVAVGDELSVASLTNSRIWVKGKVVGVGSRIVEYPVRLRKHPDLLSWGREITIKIPETSDLILGEKVLIHVKGKESLLAGLFKQMLLPQDTIAETPLIKESLPAQSSESEEKILSPVIALDNHGLEASGLLYFPDLEQYLLVSDDTPKKKLRLYWMDRTGHITRESTVAGAAEIDDIESLTSDARGTLYVAASLSAGKSGATPEPRRQLVTLKREGYDLTLEHQIDLFSMLRAAAQRDPESQWASFIREGIAAGDLDMEAIFWRDDALYLGFKTPLYVGTSIILKIDKVQEMFARRQVAAGRVSIWKMLCLRDDVFDHQECISDLFYANGCLFITGVRCGGAREAGRSGSLWRLNLNDDHLERLAHFEDLQPEGIAAAKEQDRLMICFDQGRRFQSQIALVGGLP